MSTIVQSYDASNNAVYPVTHLRAVRDSSGTTLESMMQDVREMAVGYYECSTPGSTAAKTITTDSSVSLSTKILCKVKFVEKNTANNATMDINGTGAKALYYNGVRAAANNSWYPNEVVDLYYDGTNYQAKSCADTLEYDVSLHQTHEITEITKTTRTLVFNGNVVSSWESETSISDSSVEGYTRSETNTGQDVDSTTVDGPNATYDSSANQTNVVYVTTHTYTHVVNNYTFQEAVNAVPMSYRHGGLKLRFISNSGSGQSSDNKYVQYRLMLSEFTVAQFTNSANWQGIDDEPTTGSNNLVKSRGVYDKVGWLQIGQNKIDVLNPVDNKLYNAGGAEPIAANGYKCKEVDVTSYAGKYVKVRMGNKSNLIAYCWLKVSSQTSWTSFVYNRYAAYDNYQVIKFPSVSDGETLTAEVSWDNDNIPNAFLSVVDLFNMDYSDAANAELAKSLTPKDALQNTVGNSVGKTNYNIVSKNDLISGYYIASNGALIQSIAYSYTDYIKVIAGASYRYTGGVSGSAALVFYDALQNVRGFYSSSDEVNTCVIDIPQYVSYVRLSCMNRESNSFALVCLSDIDNLVDVTNLNFIEQWNAEEVLNVEGRRWVEGYLSRNSIIGTHNTLKFTPDFIPVIEGGLYNFNQPRQINFYNKAKGLIDWKTIVSSTEIFEIPKGCYYVRVCSTDTANASLKLLKKKISLDSENDNPKTIELKDINGVTSIDAIQKNGKFRLYAEFTIDEDVNTNGGEKTLISIGSGVYAVKLFVNKAATTAKRMRPNGAPDLPILDYPAISFASGFGFRGDSSIIGGVTYEPRDLPVFIPLCGKYVMSLRYIGEIVSSKIGGVTTNTTSIKVSVTDSSIVFVGTTTGSDVINETIIIDSSDTTRDIVDKISVNTSLKDIIEAKSNLVEPVYANLTNVSDVEIVTTRVNSNQDASQGTESIACPLYLCTKVDETLHTIEIASDGQNVVILFDGQNDGQSWQSNKISDTSKISYFINTAVFKALKENPVFYIGGTSEGKEIANTFKFVRVDFNSTADAEIVRNNRIISSYNPNHIFLEGHEMWDGNELDGITPTTTLLPNEWKDIIKDPSIAMSTERMYNIAKLAKDRGYVWESPLNILNSKTKKSVCICFDDYEIDNFYNPKLRKTFEKYSALMNFAIQKMDDTLTNDTFVDYDPQIKEHLANLWRNNIVPMIHGNNAEQICTLTYNQLYTADSSIEKSIAQNTEKAREYNLSEIAWVYASGAQDVNGLFAFMNKAIMLGIQVNFGIQYYICKASHWLYLKRQNASDADPMIELIRESFADQEIPLIENFTMSVNDTQVTASFKEANKVGNIQTQMRGICFSKTKTIPTIADSLFVENNSISVSLTTSITRTFETGTYYVRAFAQNSFGIGYSEVETITIN